MVGDLFHLYLVYSVFFVRLVISFIALIWANKHVSRQVGKISIGFILDVLQ